MVTLPASIPVEALLEVCVPACCAMVPLLWGGGDSGGGWQMMPRERAEVQSSLSAVAQEISD